MSTKRKLPNLSTANVLMVGTGEYTTGYVGGTAADSDKGAGVVALTMFDLRRRNKVDRVGMCGVNVSVLVTLVLYFGVVLGAMLLSNPNCTHLLSGQEVPRYPKPHAEEYRRCLQRHGSYL